MQFLSFLLLSTTLAGALVVPVPDGAAVNVADAPSQLEAREAKRTRASAAEARKSALASSEARRKGSATTAPAAPAAAAATPSNAASAKPANGNAAAAAAAAGKSINPNFDSGAARVAENKDAQEATEFAKDPNRVKVAALSVAASTGQKIALLNKDADWKFDFNTQPTTESGPGGFIVKANLATFPVTQIPDSSMAIGVMGPCGFVTPHSHPRANELNLIIEGTLISTMTVENDVRLINQTLTNRQMTVFPQGSMHMEFNPTCGNSTFVAVFTAADGGTQQSIPAFMNFSDEIIQATMGGSLSVNGKDVDAFRKAIPINIAVGVDRCLATCGLKKRTYEETVHHLKTRGLDQRAEVVTMAEAAERMR